ncbi:hypothetical protein [Serratia entomophila]|uniref:hypothetical protein n=1 Tax=Serratia entomophila TaxID=42906 RepID=UPI00217A4B33|nr:hypothetical protein [Serratia entomophila]CAI0727973.1 Uncharacterised protein [Serratia entomophila]CAI1700377.1 Uncharacterised protein [Serratia entomophila]CAI2447970.1 Uncharacterised protein [Serratia entomophila]
MTQKWIVTHDSHKLAKGEFFEGEKLPLWLVGKATPIADQSFEVATPNAELAKLSAELETALGDVKKLTDDNAALIVERDGLSKRSSELSAELETALGQIAELMKPAKGK